MKKVSFLVVVIMGALLFPAEVWSQCPNLNFSYGNLTHWQCYAGGCSGQNYYVTKGNIPGRIDVLNRASLEDSGQLYDEHCPFIKKVMDGYDFSCRIGNDKTGAEVDGIEYTMKVDSTSSLLILSYAWVMQMAGHEPQEQPQFRMILRDTLGRTLDKIPCSYVHFTGQSGMSNLTCDRDSVVAKNWTTTAFNLEGLIGQTIKIYFETWDCTQGGHFGYAYIVPECRPMQINMAYCAGQPSVKLTAPEGFEYYKWSRSSNPYWHMYDKQIIVPSPLDGEIFTVTVRNELGCESQLKTKIEKTTVVPDFLFGVAEYRNGEKIVDFIGQKGSWHSWYDTCARTATFVDRSHVVNSKLDFIRWEIQGLNVNSRDSLFTYTFPNPSVPTTYLVKMTAFATNGCADTSKPTAHYITIYPSAEVKIEPVCYGSALFLKAVPLQHTFAQHKWSWKDASSVPHTETNDSIQIYEAGTYYLESVSEEGCIVRDSFYVTSFDGMSKLYTIEGKITHNGNPLAKTAVYIDDPAFTTDYTLTDDLGKYCIIADSNANINITPYLAGYQFNPLVIPCANISNNLYNQDFTATIPVTDINISAKQLNIPLGSVYEKLIVSVIPYNADNQTFTALSSDPAVVSVKITGSSVELSAKSIGTASVVFTTQDGGFSDTCEITVIEIPIIGICLNKNVLNISIRSTAGLSAVVVPYNTTENRSVKWESLNNTIATVSNSGTVTAIAEGTTYVIASTYNGNFGDTCKVIVIDDTGIKELQSDGVTKLRVYPNPAANQLRITNCEFKEGEAIEIYSVVGQMVYQINNLTNQQQISKSADNQINNITIDVSHLANGMYFLKVGNKTARFVKE